VFFSDEGLNGLSLHVINERAEPLAARLQLTLHRDAHGSVVAAHEQSLALAPRAQQELQVSALLPWFIDTTYAYRFGPAPHDLVTARLSDGAGNVVADAFYFPHGLPNAADADPGLTCEARRDADGTPVLTLRAERFAQSVFIDVPGYLPEDNYLHLPPKASRLIRLRGSAGAGTPSGRITALNTRRDAKVAL
jgi:beta-mannosidase